MNVFTELNNILPYLKGFGALFTLIFGGLAVYYTVKTGWAINQLQHFTDAFWGGLKFKRRTLKAWKEVSSHLQTNNPREWKLAIIEADILLGETLNILGVQGKTTGEQLKNLDKSSISQIDDVWEAHKLRNQIAHESNIDLDKETARRALSAYQSAFQELGLLN